MFHVVVNCPIGLTSFVCRRPGSFQSHVNKSVCLLIKVLEKLEDRPSLLTVIQMLLKKADPSRCCGRVCCMNVLRC